MTGLPVVELDTLFWQAGLTATTDPSEWTECQRELVRGKAWILDGDLAPYDSALDVRLWAADTVIVLKLRLPALRLAFGSPGPGTGRLLALGMDVPAPQPAEDHAEDQPGCSACQALRAATPRHGPVPSR